MMFPFPLTVRVGGVLGCNLEILHTTLQGQLPGVESDIAHSRYSRQNALTPATLPALRREPVLRDRCAGLPLGETQ